MVIALSPKNELVQFLKNKLELLLDCFYVLSDVLAVSLYYFNSAIFFYIVEMMINLKKKNI